MRGMSREAEEAEDAVEASLFRLLSLLWRFLGLVTAQTCGGRALGGGRMLHKARQ